MGVLWKASTASTRIKLWLYLFWPWSNQGYILACLCWNHLIGNGRPFKRVLNGRTIIKLLAKYVGIVDTGVRNGCCWSVRTHGETLNGIVRFINLHGAIEEGRLKYSEFWTLINQCHIRCVSLSKWTLLDHVIGLEKKKLEKKKIHKLYRGWTEKLDID